MINFYAPIWHGLSAANVTLGAITLIDIAWMLYWGVFTRRFDPPAIRWRSSSRNESLRDTVPLGGFEPNVELPPRWRVERGPR